MPDLHHQIPVNALPKQVYGAIETQKGMRGWWTETLRWTKSWAGKRSSDLIGAKRFSE
jgi:hypothetical protein